jgi:hypothetical protein
MTAPQPACCATAWKHCCTCNGINWPCLSWMQNTSLDPHGQASLLAGKPAGD